MTESKEQKVELANKWFVLWLGMKIFLYGGIIKSWYVYSLLKWIVISGMWEKYVEQKYLVWGCCDGFIIVPLWGCSPWKRRNLYVVENHVLHVDTAAYQSQSVDVMWNFNVRAIKRKWRVSRLITVYLKILIRNITSILWHTIKLLNIF